MKGLGSKKRGLRRALNKRNYNASMFEQEDAFGWARNAYAEILKTIPKPKPDR